MHLQKYKEAFERYLFRFIPDNMTFMLIRLMLAVKVRKGDTIQSINLNSDPGRK